MRTFAARRGRLWLHALVLLRALKSGVGWDYTGPEGPHEWHVKYPQCAGRMQSPIDINTSAVLYDPSMQPFDLQQYKVYDGAQMVLENVDGHTAEVKYSGTPIIIQGGSLPDRYVLDQFHFHWGEKDDNGSEHTIDSQKVPMELHIVHHMESYHNSSEAVSHPYGLAVLGFFFKIGGHNKNFDNLLGYFEKIVDKDAHVTITPFPLSNLLPEKTKAYYRYFGSLTTPPCYETVIWTLFSERIEISEDQIEKFRQLQTERQEGKNTTKVNIGSDFRPTQDLHERRVSTNVPSKASASCSHWPTGVTVVVGSALLAALFSASPPFTP